MPTWLRIAAIMGNAFGAWAATDHAWVGIHSVLAGYLVGAIVESARLRETADG